MNGVTIIACVPFLADSQLPSYRARPFLLYIEKQRAPRKEKKHQTETIKRTVPQVSMPLWYRIKASLREWYYGKNRYVVM